MLFHHFYSSKLKYVLFLVFQFKVMLSRLTDMGTQILNLGLEYFCSEFFSSKILGEHPEL
jgi:hypothetical protein